MISVMTLFCDSFLFVDDTSMFKHVYNRNIMDTANIVNHEIAKINKWDKKLLICINTKKSMVMLISRKRSPSVLPSIILNGSSLSVVKEHKQLGLTISHQLTWTSHINNITIKCNRIIGMLTRYKYLWSRSALEVCYISYIRPILEYANILYDNCTVENCYKIECVQITAARLTTGAKNTHLINLYTESWDG